MLSKVKNSLNKRKVKIFSLFLLCATLAWFVSNLSDSYTANTYFNLEYVNVPDSLFFAQKHKTEVQVKVHAGGFQLLRLNIFRKNIKIDLSNVEEKEDKYFLRQSVFRKQIEQQLPNSLSLTEVGYSDTLYVDLYKLHSKKVPVLANIKVDMAQNYVLEKGIKITPDSIKVSGPKSEIDTIVKVTAEDYNFSDVSSDISKTLQLILPKDLANTKFSDKEVVVSGSVFRFSEKLITVPVTVLNLPNDISIRTFPSEVSILCKANVEVLKKVTATDFSLTADFNDYVDENSPILKLSLTKKPEGVYSAKLKEESVEFILNRK